MTVFQFIIACLVTYRLTVLVSRDLGPWDIFKKLRAHSYGLSCPFCFSLWAGSIVETTYYLGGIRDSLVIGLIMPLALSGVAIILDRVFTSDHAPK